VVVCSERRLVFNDLNSVEPVRIYEKGVRSVIEEPQSFGEYQLKIRDGSIISPSIEPSEPLKSQCRHFLECIHTGLKPKSSAQDGINVLLTLEAIDRSVQSQGTTIKVEQQHECYAHAS
jgi:predicted dehydrogenase